MRLVLAGVLGVVVGAAGVAGSTLAYRAEAPSQAAECGTAAAKIRTTMYFGLSRPKGTVSELEWQMFLRDEVTPRFPDGLTVWEAEGQWRRPDGVVDHERSKVLLLVHPDTGVAREALESVIARYRQRFDQESVLWETARVCATS